MSFLSSLGSPADVLGVVLEAASLWIAITSAKPRAIHRITLIAWLFPNAL